MVSASSGSQVTIRLSNPSVGSLDNGRLVIGSLPAQTQPLERNDRGGHFTPQRSACPCVRYPNKYNTKPSPYVEIYRVLRPGYFSIMSFAALVKKVAIPEPGTVLCPV
jgi:hypothetical protein